MGLISRSYSFVAGAIPTAANFNVDINQLFTLINGQLDAANVDETSADGVATLNSVQTFSGAKTFSAAATFAGATFSAVTIDGVGADVDAVLDLQLDGTTNYRVTVDDSVAGDPVVVALRGTDVATWDDADTLPQFRIGPTDTSGTEAYVLIENTSYSSTPTQEAAGLAVKLTRTTGTEVRNLLGVVANIDMDQAAESANGLIAMEAFGTLTDGTANSVFSLFGIGRIDAGTINQDLMGIQTRTDGNGGTVTQDAIGYNNLIDLEAAMACVDVYGMLVDMDNQATYSGTGYGVAVTETNGVDYAFYHTGAAPSVFGSNVGVGGATSFGSGTNTIGFIAGTAPSSNLTNGVLLYATGANAELTVRDELGNVTTLS